MRLPSLPNTSEFAGLGSALGCGIEEGGVPSVGMGGGGIGAEANIPPCKEHNCVGAVPSRKGNSTLRGQASVAKPPEAGSIVAISTPEGCAKSGASSGAVEIMKSTHAGRADCAPVIPVGAG